MTRTVLLGVDVGSSGAKAVAIDPAGRVVTRSATHPYPTRYPQPGWAEQDPEDWYAGACRALRDCLASGSFDASDVAAIAIDGPAHNAALLDVEDRPLCPTLHWSDTRSAAQARRLEAEMGDVVWRITRQPVHPSWTLSQLLWVRETAPRVWANLRRVLVTKDYVRYRLTGVAGTDPYDATGSQLFDVERAEWSEELRAFLSLPKEALPPVLEPFAVTGAVTSRAAADTGLLTGTPVAVGSGDSVVEAAGAGAIHPGQGIIKLGTAANVNVVTADPRPSLRSLTYPHVRQPFWFTITATNSGGATLRWFADALLAAGAGAGTIYQRIDELAAGAPPGSAGLIFHPYLMGERTPLWDPSLRGDFVGLSAHHTLAHLARAVLEGVAFSLRDCLQTVIALGAPFESARLLGGGARSALWQRIICDILALPLIKPQIADAAYGSALLAGIAANLFEDWEAAVAPQAGQSTVLAPDAQRCAVYDAYFETYRAITHDLARHHHRLVELAANSGSQDEDS